MRGARCADQEELLLLLDGELTENEAARLRRHLRVCGVCAARAGEFERTIEHLKLPTPEADPSALVEEVMRRLPTAVADASALQAPRRARRWAFLGGGVMAVMAMSALLATPRMLHRADEGSGGFTARGAPLGASMRQGVGVTVLRPRVSREPLASETQVHGDDAYAVRYRNLLGGAVYLLAFAVDSAGQVHWIAPTYLDPGDNPVAVTLSPATTETALPPAMQLESPSSGALRFVAILSLSPLHVLDVDGLRGGELSTESLRARWPAADVRELANVQVAPSP